MTENELREVYAELVGLQEAIRAFGEATHDNDLPDEYKLLPPFDELSDEGKERLPFTRDLVKIFVDVCGVHQTLEQISRESGEYNNWAEEFGTLTSKMAEEGRILLSDPKFIELQETLKKGKTDG